MGVQDGPSPTLAGVSLAALSDNSELCLFTLSQSGIAFQPLPDIQRTDGCSLTDAVEAAAIGLPYNRPVVATCRLAAAMAIFEQEVLQPAAQRHFGERVARVEHWGSYACRRRNSRGAGQWSEHARANAIDIAAFELADGRKIAVEQGWRAGGRQSAFLREVRKGACGVFHGVISPAGDAKHRDHLHLDMGRWRFCR